MKTETFHHLALEMETLLEDVIRLLKRSALQNTLSRVEMAGYTRRMDRLREISKELQELAR